MTKLLKTDLKRIVKDKLFVVVCIIGAVFSLVTPFLYKLLFSGIDMSEGEDIISMFVSINGMFFQSFSMSNNFGLIVPILLIIIIFKDFTFGTIRNKIVSGHSRTSIFFSMFISSAIIITGVICAHAALTGIISLALFSNTLEKITVERVVYFITSIGFEILICIFIASVLSFLTVFTKNVGLGIICCVAIFMGASIVISILQVALEVLKIDGQNQNIVDVLQFLLNTNVFYNNSFVIGLTDTYKIKDVIYILISILFPTSLLVLFGILKINKKDIK